MNLSELEEALKREHPHLRCGNRTEFRQRLQWLSEGMLRNHIEHIRHYSVDLQEMEAYRRFKERRDELAQT